MTLKCCLAVLWGVHCTKYNAVKIVTVVVTPTCSSRAVCWDQQRLHTDPAPTCLDNVYQERQNSSAPIDTPEMVATRKIRKHPSLLCFYSYCDNSSF